MAWRFADLPVRTKFLVTLGLPVLGMVLLIGKQVDASLKRSTVYSYINERSALIGIYSGAMHEVQGECARSVGFLLHQGITESELIAQFGRTDQVIARLHQAATPEEIPAEGFRAFDGLDVMRRQVLARSAALPDLTRHYRTIGHDLLDELGGIARLALDPETKDRLYAHLRLLNAKHALAAIGDLLSIGTHQDVLNDGDMAQLVDQISQYETNVLLFERDAAPDVLRSYREVFQGADINFMRSIIGTVKQKRSVGHLGVSATDWRKLSIGAIAKLRVIEDRSLTYIVEATSGNLRDARLRLLITLTLLVLVVGSVSFMGFRLLRGLRRTVNEVTRAARSLASGEVGSEVPVSSADEIGQMALSFNVMIHNIRTLANSAEAIGKGNYDTPVPVRGSQDILGLALTRMRENLKAARMRDTEQTLALQSEKAKLEQANERIHLLIKEMHHRVKNNLQVIASLLRLQAGSFSDERLQRAFDQSQSRVTSMALIHEKLYKGDELAKVDVGPYIAELFAELVRLNDVGERIQCRTDIDEGLAFDLTTMVPLGLLLNELITNSMKHAYPQRKAGNIGLAVHRVGQGEYDLIYSDDGVGIPLEKLQGEVVTLGVTLIESLVDQMNGRMTVESDAGGTRYHIRFRTG